VTDDKGLSEALLLHQADRLVAVENQVAGNTAMIAALHDGIVLLRSAVTDLVREFSELRSSSMIASRGLEQLQRPLEGLVALKQRFSGAWLLATAMVMLAAYLFQPLLNEVYRRFFELH
jgi:hypothetical protein